MLFRSRPPANEAHYHSPDSDRMFIHFMNRAAAAPNVRIVLLPRNTRQAASIQETHPDWFANAKTVIPTGAVDGLNLLWHSDLVVSGGGTMNREAAALGVPVYSIFRGPTGAVDRHLHASGRLIMLENVNDIDARVQLVRRKRRPLQEAQEGLSLLCVVRALEEIIAAENSEQP